MRIRKVSQTTPVQAQIVDGYSTSSTDGYSAHYINQRLDAMYPVGSIYMSVNSTNPSTLFGGTWEQLEDRFLLGASSTYSAGSTGGGTTTGQASGNTGSTTLTIEQIPGHTHNFGMRNGNGGWTVSAMSNGAKTNSGITDSTGGGKGHTHTLNNHTHSQALPPYLAVYMWKRVS